MMFRKFALAGIASTATLFATPAWADTLIDNVVGITINADGEVERFTGLVISDDGKVRELVKSGDPRPGSIDYQIDGEGRVMLPGMIDSHVHVMGIGFGQLTLDLSRTNSLEEALDAVRNFAEANPGRPWIIGRGWNQEKWGLGRFPTAAELDAVVSDRPVWLARVDGHAGWANSLAMSKANVTRASTDPNGGRIIRDPAGNPTGVFIDAAESFINAIVPEPRPSDRDVALHKAQDVLLASGITAVADMGTSVEDWQAFRRAGDHGSLKIRIMAYANDVKTMELIAGPAPTPWLYEDRLRLNGIKLYLDGALGSRGAVLKQPYHDESDHHGLALLTPAQLRNLMSRAAMDGFQTAIHAIGDAANAEVLDAISELSETYSGDRRWRIEHAQIVDPDDIVRFGQNGTIASMQPLHQTSDRLMAEARLGPDRLGGAYAWRSIAAAGAPLAFGSDAPVEPADAFAGLSVAISRTDADGEPFGGWLPGETISRDVALAGFTAEGAYAGFADGRFGRLIAGERADFILVDRDPMLSSPQDIREMQVLETWIGGERVFENK